MASKKETTLKEIWDKLEENQLTLREIARWLRFQNISKLKDVLVTELDSEEKKLAFENTDGSRALDEVAKMSGTPRDTLYSWWKKWSNLGILEASETRKGRLRRICSLEDVGIKVPKVVGKEKKEPPEEVKTDTSSEMTKV